MQREQGAIKFSAANKSPAGGDKERDDGDGKRTGGVGDVFGSDSNAERLRMRS